MTKIRRHRTVEDAVAKVAGHLTVGAVAEVLCKSAATVYYFMDPDHPNCPTISQALAMDLAYMADTNAKPPLLEYYQRQIKTAQLTPPDQDLTLAVLDLNKSIGFLNGAVKNAKEPSSPGGAEISEEERLTILKALDQVRSQIKEIERRMKSPTLKEVS